MLELYLFSAAFGIVLVGASAFLGGDELDFDGDADVDVDVDVDVDAGQGDIGSTELAVSASDSGAITSGLLAPFLSMRFWTYALGGFGVTGATLSALGTALVFHLPLAILLGMGLGYTASWGFRMLQQSSVDSTSHANKLSGLEGVVMLTIGPERKGKIRVKTHGQLLEVMATTPEQRTLEPGSNVLIVRSDGGIAVVEPLSTPTRKGSDPETT